MSGNIYLDANAFSVGEANNTVSVIFRRTGDLSTPVTITYGVTDDTATAGVDYTIPYSGASGTVTIPAGQDRAIVPIHIINDNVSEPTESFVVSIINVDNGFITAPRTSHVEILDDENPVVDPPQPPLVSDYDVTKVPVVQNINQPIKFLFAPQNPNWVYIAEKPGYIQVANIQTGQIVSTLLDIHNQVNEAQDRGILDVALHPDFVHNPYVYVFFVVDPADTAGKTGNAGPDGGGNRFSYVERFTADAATNFTTLVANSGVVILGKGGQTLSDISGGGALDFTNADQSGQTASDAFLTGAHTPVIGGFKQDYLKMDSRSHAGGSLAFGPDGALYVSTGDGTSYDIADPRAPSVQSLNTLSGKILRVDPMTGQGLADNPFVTSGISLDSDQGKIYQLGLRNPFSIAFDPNGHLIITDTGWNSWEEINTGGPGANFGWPYFEGTDGGINLKTPTYKDFSSATAFYQSVTNGSIVITAPFRAFSHTDSDPGFQVEAITGGSVFYSGDKYPAEFQNNFFFTDFSDGETYTVNIDDRRDVKFLLKSPQGVVDYVQGPDGYVYYADLEAGQIGRLLISKPAITVQAEALTLAGYQVEGNGAASGGALIRLPLGGTQGTATLQSFTGATGTYDLNVSYFDENDGASTFSVLLNGTVVGSWTANAPGPDSLAGADDLKVQTLAGLSLHTGDTIAIRGTVDGNEFARVDKIAFVPKSPPPPSNAPVAVNDTGTALETDGAKNFAVLANDTDANDPLSALKIASIDTSQTKGLAAINGQNISYDPNGAFESLAQNQTATDIVRYVVADNGTGGHNDGNSTGTLTVTVTGVNDAPTAQDQTATTSEDAPVTASFAADDIDSDDSGSSLVYQILTGPAKGSATVNANGTFTFNPGAAFQALGTGQSEQVSFTYHATDSHGAVSTTQTVTVTVNGADEPPPGPITVEAESLTLAGYQVEGNGAASGGALIRLPLGGTQGTATLQSFAGATGTYDLNVSYFDENDGASTFSVLVNGTVVGSWTANAPGPDSLAGADDLKVQTLAGLSLHTGDTIAIRGTVDGNEFARVDKIAFVPKSPPPPSNAPVAVNDTGTALETDGAKNFAVLANDTDANDPLSALKIASIDTSQTKGLAAINGQNISYDPNGAFESLAQNQTATDIVRYVVADNGTGGHNDGNSTGTLTVTVTGVNDAPTAQDQTATTSEDAPVTASFAADDIDSDDSGSSLVYQILTGPAKGSATVNANGTFTFNPGAAFQALGTGQSEQVSFTYHATDSHGAVSTTQTVTVTVNGADEPPPGPITVEAESLTLAGYQVEGNGAASGGALIRLPLGGTQGTATLQSFAGATGTYDLNVSYFDENDGASTFSVLVNGTVVGSWTANAPGPDSLAGADDLKVQTLAGLSLHTGDTIAIRGTVDGNEFARVDKIAFAPAQAGTFNYEAENLVLSGYQVEANAAASGGALIRIPLGAAQGAQGTATLQSFAGASGNYDLQIAYFDENDGAATFNVLVNGNVVGSWVANAPGPDALAGADNLMVHTLSAIALHQGDTIALRGTFNGDEYARIDALHIAAHSDPVV